MQASAARAGIGLRQPHYVEIDTRRPALGFVEVHSENFFNPVAPAAAVLQGVREVYAVSLHGVGLSLGSACGIDTQHLDQLAQLVERIEPCRVSDHASFARGSLRHGTTVHANDLLPLAFTDAQLTILVDNVQRVQERLRRPLLVENLSSYLGWRDADWSEAGFFAELGRRSGCGLLLDVNNLMVNARNAKFDNPVREVCRWMDELATLAPPDIVGEIHLAGHSQQGDLIVDDHSDVVSLPVWMAYTHALRRFGGVPTLIEWDTSIPALDVLLDEAAQAQALLDDQHRAEAAMEGTLACAA